MISEVNIYLNFLKNHIIFTVNYRFILSGKCKIKLSVLISKQVLIQLFLVNNHVLISLLTHILMNTFISYSNTFR